MNDRFPDPSIKDDRPLADAAENDSSVPHEPPPGQPISAWARLLVGTCIAFVLTVLLMVVAAFSRQAARLAGFFDRHGVTVLVIEVGVIIGLALVVLGVERRRSG